MYLVGIGGSSRDTWDEYEDLADAEAACLRMAEELADDRGRGEEVELYEDYVINSRGEFLERGACPVDDCGAYWPRIKEV